jgi:hypothetical protein
MEETVDFAGKTSGVPHSPAPRESSGIAELLSFA